MKRVVQILGFLVSWLIAVAVMLPFGLLLLLVITEKIVVGR